MKPSIKQLPLVGVFGDSSLIKQRKQARVLDFWYVHGAYFSKVPFFFVHNYPSLAIQFNTRLGTDDGGWRTLPSFICPCAGRSLIIYAIMQTSLGLIWCFNYTTTTIIWTFSGQLFPKSSSYLFTANCTIISAYSSLLLWPLCNRTTLIHFFFHLTMMSCHCWSTFDYWVLF